MTLSKVKFKRSWPALGTWVTLQLEDLDSERVGPVAESFRDELFRLQKIFNFHDPESELNRRASENELSPELGRARELANQLQELSQGAFTARRGDRWDFGGLAKGLIVDLLCEFLESRQQDLRGSVNAGGDLRFLGVGEWSASLRLGSPEKPSLQHVALGQRTLATSCLSAKSWSPESSTVYWGTAKGFDSVVVVSPECAWSDGLTKVALFAERDPVIRVCEAFNAAVFCFDGEGQLVASHGAL